MAARTRSLLLPSSMIAAAAAVGLLAVASPLTALAAAAAIVFVYVVFSALAAGFAVLAFLTFLDILPTSGSLSPAKGAGILIAVAWAARSSTQEGERSDFFRDYPYLTWLLVGFVAWTIVSLLWASQLGPGVTAVTRYVPNVLLLPIACTAIAGRSDLRTVMIGILIGALLAALSGIVAPPDAAVVEERATGTIGDPNELAAALLVGLSVGAGFALARGLSPALRFLGAVAVPLCAMGIFLSLSRGGLIALGLMLVAGTMLAGRWRFAVTAILVLIALGGTVYFVQFASLPARERISTAEGGSGRSDLWKLGLRMLSAHPLGGVGVGNFPVVSRNYVLRPGTLNRTDLVFAHEPKVTHNTYLQVLAETGFIGFLLFAGILISCVTCAWRAAQRWMRTGQRTLEALARGVLLGMIGIIVADFFISEMYSKLLWTVLALGPAMLAVARRERDGGTDGDLAAG